VAAAVVAVVADAAAVAAAGGGVAAVGVAAAVAVAAVCGGEVAASADDTAHPDYVEKVTRYGRVRPSRPGRFMSPLWRPSLLLLARRQDFKDSRKMLARAGCHPAADTAFAASLLKG